MSIYSLKARAKAPPSTQRNTNPDGKATIRKQGIDFPLVSKPIHPEELLKKVAQILNSSELHQTA